MDPLCAANLPVPTRRRCTTFASPLIANHHQRRVPILHHDPSLEPPAPRSRSRQPGIGILLLSRGHPAPHPFPVAPLFSNDGPTPSTTRTTTAAMARVYANVNAQMPRSYWDYDGVNISWGVLEK
ncbi:hypothetical protein IMZ48_44875 [Candidatus Bathyarchaeota archaeon]|nr:hypothetical protein [Candidatus Bathyarchaeota archaeon]